MIIEKIKYNKGDVEFEIPQIIGLKNKDIENKINKDIENKILTAINKNDDLLFAYNDIGANFSNILSIDFNYNSSDGFGNINLNYNLINGEELQFEDLFVDDADIYGIVRKAMYDTLSQQNIDYDEYYGDNKKPIYPDENKLYNYLKNFMAEENKLFYLNSQYIIIRYGDIRAYIWLKDYKDEIAIYNRFKTEDSLFIDDNIGIKNMFYFTNAYMYSNFDILKYGLIEENMWYEIAVLNYNTGLEPDDVKTYEEFKNNHLSKYYDELENYRKIARENPDRFYIFLAQPALYLYRKSYYDANINELVTKKSNLVSFKDKESFYEMPYSAYEDTYKDRIVEAYVSEFYFMNGGAKIDLSINGDNEETIQDSRVKVSSNDNTKLYNFLNDKEYATVQSLFKEDVDYTQYINPVLEKYLRNSGFDDNTINEFINSVEYILNGFTLSAKSPISTNTVEILFDDIEESVLSFFD